MFDFYLPLEDFFIKILLENKIQNWEANLFWLNIEHLSQIETKEQRQQMYNGLRVLTSNDYLRVEYSKYNRRIFLYSETLKLHQFRRNVLAENYNEVILNEKKLIIKELENFESLSMVVIDNNYNEKDGFIMSDCIFSEDIESVQSTLQIPLNNTGENICVIFIDIYGNEFKQVIKTK